MVVIGQNQVLVLCVCIGFWIGDSVEGNVLVLGGGFKIKIRVGVGFRVGV